MDKIQQLIQTKSEFSKFTEIILKRLKDNTFVSYNKVLDEMVIGIIINDNANVMDYTINPNSNVEYTKNVQLYALWLFYNENKIIEVLKENGF